MPSNIDNCKVAFIFSFREGLEQGSITLSPSEIMGDYRGKPVSWEGFLNPPSGAARKAAVQGELLSSGVHLRPRASVMEIATTGRGNTCCLLHCRVCY